ncbi:hypothetical protein, partial [Pleomorphochaeta sp. DL1XJH-081]|uniref:hypothetical protein n=1 Tax=Pleomorphochaeta sp. DL1XJH-081 TaxID=3409690 RepID=UPI003BB6B9DA
QDWTCHFHIYFTCSSPPTPEKLTEPFFLPYGTGDLKWSVKREIITPHCHMAAGNGGFFL